MNTCRQRYDELTGDRSQFLDKAWEASRLTLPYLVRREEDYVKGMRVLPTPWQSVGAKGVNALAAKLMLALLPTQTAFFKLQINESNVPDLVQDPTIRAEMELSFSKIERTILESIAASSDRVVVHQALKHLIVSGNALVYMGKEGLKLYPLNRYVIDRDGNGNVLEIITKEKVNKKLVEKYLPKEQQDSKPDSVGRPKDYSSNEVDVYTHVRRENNRVVWYQEIFDKAIPGSYSKAPLDQNPWLPLRFNISDGEPYGRGRVEEFIGDLKSLEALSQALVEGSAAAAKVVFVVSPSSTTKPQTLAKAGNGAIVTGRPDDIGVIQVGKGADFATAQQQMMNYEKRLSEAFLILNVRDSERTTAEEVRMTQMELETQLGGLFSLLTTEFLVPYLNRKLAVLQRDGSIPKLPKDIVSPTIVAGVNALGRGQDRESLTAFITTISQTMGPEAVGSYINQDEFIKRLAAAQGIDVLNLVKGQEEVQQAAQASAQQQVQSQKDIELTKQAAAFANSPVMDPQVNPNAPQAINDQQQTNQTAFQQGEAGT